MDYFHLLLFIYMALGILSTFIVFKPTRKMKEKCYALNVIKYDKDGGVLSHYHGWSTNSWKYTKKEALSKKEKIAHLFDEIEIIDLRDNN